MNKQKNWESLYVQFTRIYNIYIMGKLGAVLIKLLYIIKPFFK